MRWFACGLLLSAALLLVPTPAFAADHTVSIMAEAPRFPTPLQAAILGLSLTAVAVVGARASQRSSDTMMYMVLASLAVTAVMVAYADRLHGEFLRAGLEKLQELQQHAAR
jgi:purine-cytosine permease-like protein